MLPAALQSIRLPQFPRAFQTYKRKPEPPVAGAILLCSPGGGAASNYLLVRGRHSGKWSFPKGHKEDFETLEETIQREVQEEVGIESLPPYLSEFQGRVGTYRVFDLSLQIRPCPQDLDEVDAADWFSLKEIATMSLNVDTSYYFLKVHGVRTSSPSFGKAPMPTGIPDGVTLRSRCVTSSL
jgi:8-oxo-dGTP pyrophosphatase MutT (NUDIX family)